MKGINLSKELADIESDEAMSRMEALVLRRRVEILADPLGEHAKAESEICRLRSVISAAIEASSPPVRDYQPGRSTDPGAEAMHTLRRVKMELRRAKRPGATGG